MPNSISINMAGYSSVRKKKKKKENENKKHYRVLTIEGTIKKTVKNKQLRLFWC